MPLKITVQSSIMSFRVEAPRHLFRGHPDNWGFGVVVMGMDPTGQPGVPAVPGGHLAPGNGGRQKGSEGALGRPMPVLSEPGPRHFGGAWPDNPDLSPERVAPPFMDLLVPPGMNQRQLLQIYKQGREVVIPLMRPL